MPRENGMACVGHILLTAVPCFHRPGVLPCLGQVGAEVYVPRWDVWAEVNGLRCAG